MCDSLVFVPFFLAQKSLRYVNKGFRVREKSFRMVCIFMLVIKMRHFHPSIFI